MIVESKGFSILSKLYDSEELIITYDGKFRHVYDAEAVNRCVNELFAYLNSLYNNK